MKTKFFMVLFAVVTSAGLTACVPHYRTNPELVGKTADIKGIVLLEPDIQMTEISAGGVSEEVQEWSAAGVQNVTRAIVERLGGNRIPVKVLKREDESQAAEIKEILALHEVVSTSIIFHTYNPAALFPEKKAHFDYSLGSLESLLQKEGSDLLLIVQGQDQVATAGRKALNVLRVLTGVPLESNGYLLAVLAARNGDVLWFNFVSNGGNFDLRDLESSAKLVTATMAGFPELNR